MSKQGNFQGIYQYNGIVSGRNSWKSEDNAFWYIPEFKEYSIGNLADIGTTNRGITSVIDEDKDKYWDGVSWKDVQIGDITISCISGKKAKTF